MKVKIAVVIPNWNGADLIAACIESLQKQTIPADVIVVDNGSRDESVSIIESSFPGVTLIRLAENTGFAGGVNTGIRHALEKKYDAIALFNNDAVADKNWLKNLSAVLGKTPDAGIVTGKFMREDRKHIDSTGEYYSVWGMPFPRGRNRKDTGQFDKPEAVFGATGGATLYRTSMLEKIGLFDETFFAYLEDIDISFRAHLAGWDVLYEPSAVAYHHIGATSSRLGSFTRYHFVKNFHLTYLKNMPGRLFWKYLPLAITQSLRLAAGSIVRGYFPTFVRAYFTAVRLIPHALRERRRIQGSRKVSIDAIDGLLYHGRPPKIPTF